jgi:thioredoxin 1
MSIKERKMKNALIRSIFLFFWVGFLTLSFSAAAKKADENNKSTTTAENYMVTFVELGSVRCIPCKLMQPIMKDIEKDFANQVKVVFHDVWTPEGEPFAASFKIRVIPTQVFLDKEGKEYFRHEGFFPKDELIKVLQQKGVK